MASTVAVPRSIQEVPGNPGYLASHYAQVFRGGLSFSGFERDRLYWNGADGKFFDVSPISGCDSPGDGRGAAFADLDDDGDTDVFVHNVQGNRHQLFRNDTGDRAGWVRLTLEGTRSNRDAVGALVTIKVGERKLLRTVVAGSGFASCSDRRILAGLGEAACAEGATIRWPSGLVQELGRLARGKSYRVVEGRAPVEIEPRPARLGGTGLVALRVGPGQRMVPFDLPGLAGGRATSATGGRWHLVNFWHPGCAPCRAEMPALQRLAKQYAARLSVSGLALIKPVEGPAAVKAAAAARVTYPIAMVPSELAESLFSAPDLPIPTTYLVNPDGLVTHVYQGGDSVPALEAALAAALR